jgi:hypothetical protein
MVDVPSVSLYVALVILAITLLLATRIRHGPIRSGGADALKRPAASDPLSHAVSAAGQGDFRAVLLLLATELRRRVAFLPAAAEDGRLGFEELAKKLQGRAAAGKVESLEAEAWVAQFRDVVNESRVERQRR